MCGIAGVWGPGAGRFEDAVARMRAQMRPRGPDDGGTLAVGGDSVAGVLGARRLAIIDPSPAGHQPFIDEERGNAIVFNGMIYNYRELKRELEGLGERFSSNCDTEVILKAFGRFGPGCVERLNGMFAFAVWNAEDASLFLARDRIGIKPLYYAVVDGRLVFGSQVKTLLASGIVPGKISPAGIRSYLNFGAVSDPVTIIDGVSALEAGQCGTWCQGGLELRHYWRADQVPARELGGPGELRSLLEDAVARHMISDVPIGVFLSGGLDSSLLAALASHHDGLKTVSIRFAEGEYSEAAYQRQMVERLGCDSVAVTLGAKELFENSSDTFRAMDQPSFDGFNTHAVSMAASGSGLKVALSGLGADELFDGYGYVRRIRRLEAARRLPAPLRALAARGVGRLGGGSQGRKGKSWLVGELPRGASYELLRHLFLPGEVDALAPGDARSPSPARINMKGDLWNQVCALDLRNYTRNVLLRDTDAMSMSVGLEVRVPYLSDDLVEWALSTPGKVRGIPGKRMLVDATRDLIPPAIATRSKHGFLLPIADWMKGPLKEEIEADLNHLPGSLAHLLDAKMAWSVWNDFEAGKEHWLRPWSLYVLCRWTRELLPSTAG